MKNTLTPKDSNKFVNQLAAIMPRQNGTPEGIEALRKSLERSVKK